MMKRLSIRGVQVNGHLVWDVAEGEPQTQPGMLDSVMQGDITPEKAQQVTEHAWPFLYDFRDKSFWVGGEGWYHTDIFNKVPTLLKRYEEDKNAPVEKFNDAFEMPKGFYLGRVEGDSHSIKYYGNVPDNATQKEIQSVIYPFLNTRYDLGADTKQEVPQHKEEDEWVFARIIPHDIIW